MSTTAELQKTLTKDSNNIMKEEVRVQENICLVKSPIQIYTPTTGLQDNRKKR